MPDTSLGLPPPDTRVLPPNPIWISQAQGYLLMLRSSLLQRRWHRRDFAGLGKSAPIAAIHSAKTKIGLLLQLFCDCGLPRDAKTRTKPEKMANWTRGGPFPPRKGRKGVRNRKKVAQKSEFLFLRDGSSQRSIPCERRVRPPKPIGSSSSTEPCDINQARHSRPRLRQRPRAGPTELTLAKSRTNPTENATSEEKRWAKQAK